MKNLPEIFRILEKEESTTEYFFKLTEMNPQVQYCKSSNFQKWFMNPDLATKNLNAFSSDITSAIF